MVIIIFLILHIILISFPDSAVPQNLPLENIHPVANFPTEWINNPFSLSLLTINNPPPLPSMTLQPILVRTSSPQFVCGFYCNSRTTDCLLAVLIFFFPSSSSSIDSPQLIWSANRDSPVKVNAILRLQQNGELALSDSDGTPIWSSNTQGNSVSGLNLTDLGNLVLFGPDNESVWESFDHPTDSLLPGQKLVSNQRLISSISDSNWGQGQYGVVVTDQRLNAYIDPKSDSPNQLYYRSNRDIVMNRTAATGESYLELRNGSFGEFIFRPTVGVEFLRIDPDGHLRVHEWNGTDWAEAADLLAAFVGECGYPMVCGTYGICSTGKQCSCPEGTNSQTNFFKQQVNRQPDLGCLQVRPVSCQNDNDHSSQHLLFELQNIDYFSFQSSVPYNNESDLEGCKSTCLSRCSCRAALFRPHSGSSTGNCLLLDEVFSLMNDDQVDESAIAFLKVQSPPGKGKRFIVKIVAGCLAALIGVCLVIGSVLLLYKKKNGKKGVEEDFLDQLQGMPSRYSYEELKTLTNNFSHKLGEGGFGCVYEGSVGRNGTKVAVKVLSGVGVGKKSFLAEVETIGSIHHVNLVRLIGFCAENSHRLLVYEYMKNGSLNKWIFPKNRVVSLKWESRKKIILQIAKGLAYLHEECRHKILHLDIKPQNILLDENFNAKVSDFGLSKLIDKDQSQVMTTLRGTPGYLAPEWLSSTITEKVDVYSFGVVVLEILCGRKNLDRSRAEEDMHLLSLFKYKEEEERLSEIIDQYSEDMVSHQLEVVEMMRVAAWCLQSDFARRPSMGVVVKVLDGLVDVEVNLDFNFMNPLPPPPPLKTVTAAADAIGEATGASTPLLPSYLSGPR